jgi:hypothetical protein
MAKKQLSSRDVIVSSRCPADSVFWVSMIFIPVSSEGNN